MKQPPHLLLPGHGDGSPPVDKVFCPKFGVTDQPGDPASTLGLDLSLRGGLQYYDFFGVSESVISSRVISSVTFC